MMEPKTVSTITSASRLFSSAARATSSTSSALVIFLLWAAQDRGRFFLFDYHPARLRRIKPQHTPAHEYLRAQILFNPMMLRLPGLESRTARSSIYSEKAE